MKRSILSVAAVLLMVFAAAVRAEETDPEKSPFAALGKQYVEAYNKKDAAIVATLFAEDAIRVNASGIIRGRAAIQKAVEAGLEAGNHDLTLRYHVAHIDGNTGWAVVESNSLVRGKDGTDTPARGFTTSVYVRDGGAWKIKAQTVVNAPPPK